MQLPVVAFIVGAHLSSIITDVRRDRAWKRLGLAAWEDEDGRHVRYLTDPTALHGTSGARVYFAPGHKTHHAWPRIKDMLDERDCECVDL